ncbi:TolC family protein [Aestuariibacter sp. GS-14]|uniref:TolC family protein n=1 Tax=Aestuariibacter sp. GS-14 TaxID=2590670 RepID=UPI0011291E7F|nr:TolC family protein [Aestuariibacter sp. GS-14]TPV58987.1 TolC family protein [Aestuariibacter sp. GS-14]
MLYKNICVACLLTLSTGAYAQAKNWAGWLLQTVDTHPSILALKHDARASGYQAAAFNKPLYNPSLDTSLEREGSEINYQIGLSSQLDWHDVQSSQIQAGNFLAEQSQLALEIARSDLLSESLKAQISLTYAERQYEIATKRVNQSIELLNIIGKKVETGEVPEITLAFTKAATAEAMVAESEWLTSWQQAKQDVVTVLGRTGLDTPISDNVWTPTLSLLSPGQVQQLPSLRYAHLSWLIATNEVDVQRTSNKPVPTVGFGVGRQAGEPLLSLSMSVPLNIRNDFIDVTEVAKQRALASEQQLQAEVIAVREAISSTYQQLQLLGERYRIWEQIDSSDFTVQAQVLVDRFSAGDLPFTEFHAQLNELLSGQQAALTLTYQYQLAYINYLHQSAGLVSHISALADEE